MLNPNFSHAVCVCVHAVVTEEPYALSPTLLAQLIYARDGKGTLSLILGFGQTQQRMEVTQGLIL